MTGGNLAEVGIVGPSQSSDLGSDFATMFFKEPLRVHDKTIAICYSLVNSTLHVPSGSSLLSNCGMEIKDIRLANMLLLRGDGTLEQLAERIGTNPAYLSQINTGHRSMGNQLARQFEKKLKKSKGWMDVEHSRQELLTPGPDVQARIPLISWVRAGRFDEARDPYHVGDAEDWFPMPKKAGPNTYCLRVEGDSMTAQYGKSYPAGSVIFVDPDQRSPANGQRVIAKLNGTDEVTFKVFVQEAGKTFLRPLNQQYPMVTQAFRVLGTVIGKWEDD